MIRFARLCWLGGELTFAFARYLAEVRLAPAEQAARKRALWLQKCARRILRVFGVKLDISGELPHEGLLVCNHLGYLDILVIASLVSARFISKREVRNWPIFGALAHLAGTLFVDREKRGSAARSGAELREALEAGELVVLFPEGTSSGGAQVLPFKSALLEPVAHTTYSLSAGFIQYSLPKGSVPDEVCYWRDMTLFPHLLNLLGKREISARIAFTRVQKAAVDRKQLARQLHSEVVRLKEAFSY
jgi:1-acyl-sn-glycerol-3-phosphate acyltransferase